MSRTRRLLKPLAGALAGIAAAVAVLLVAQSRDEPELGASAPVPGQPYRGEPVLSPALEDAVGRGNVVVLHRNVRPPDGARELQAGAPATLAARGLAVLLEPEPTLRTQLAAVSQRRILYARRPESLRPFIDHHLGR